MSERAGEPREVLDSEPNVGEEHGLSGGMGVSSERVGKVRGSAEPATSGAEDLSSEEPADPPPEQSADPRTGPEVQPANDLPPHQWNREGSPGHLPGWAAAHERPARDSYAESGPGVRAVGAVLTWAASGCRRRSG